MTDYHVHPDFSKDASGSIRDFCGRAREIGLDEICFTTHYEPDPGRAHFERVRVDGRPAAVDSDWPDSYLAEIEAARRQFPGLVIRAGVEAGYELGIEGILSDFLSRHAFDFVLGAVHCLDHVAITARDEMAEFERVFGQSDAGTVVARYFHYVRAAAGCALFDCLAHLDIYRKYVRPRYGPEFDEAVEVHLPAALEAVARSGVGLEVNTSAWRRGDDEPYPGRELLRRARDAGVRVFVTGSDAHRPEDLGRDLDRAEAELAALGLAPARFEARRRLDPPGPPGARLT